VVIAALGGASATAEEVPYQGVAALCAVEAPGETDSKGGITYTTGVVMIFRIETSHPLINGNERLESNSRLNPAGRGYYWGYGKVFPDESSGTLEGDFFFRSKDVMSIQGTYYGTGDLTDVIMSYELTPAEFDPSDPICGGVPPMGGYLISGTVEGYNND